MQKIRTAAVAAFVAASVAGPVAAQTTTFPVKPIRLLVGSPPGAPSDIISRVIAERLGERYKVAVTVENKPGAGNSLASREVGNAAPDGHTLIINPDTVFTINPHVYKNLGFDASKELVPVSIVGSFSQMLVCNSSHGFKTVDDLLAKAKTTRLMYGSGGAGVPGHLAFALLLDATKVSMDHVPYKGPSPAMTAVLSGEVACGFLATPSVLPHVKSGRVNALAVSSAQPSPLAPDVPPLTKALHRNDVDATFKLVLMAPKATPAPVLADIERAVKEVLAPADVRAKLAANDVVTVASTAAEAKRALQADSERWGGVVKRIDLKVE
jgi:tripartite-type tricarboxylate transporter receptor subunit TctC